MSNITNDIVERLGLLSVEINGINAPISAATQKIDPAALPAFMIKPIGSTRANPNRMQLTTTRTFLMGLLVQQFGDNKDAAKQASLEECHEYLDIVPEFFIRRPRLELNGQPLKFIDRVDMLNDDGPQLFEWGGDICSAILFRVPITFSKSV